ncbi:MAG: hypothetical protein QMD53_02610 [Actinomycetota bacterium]|nr:hypothetical protein [Actinomycetota bacterium]
MKQILYKATVASALSVLMIFTIVVSALAGTASSSYSNFTCGSYGYRNKAEITTVSPGGAAAATYIGSWPSTTRPTGWFGALARLYTDAGVLKKQEGYNYTGSPCVGYFVYTPFYNVRGSYL